MVTGGDSDTARGVLSSTVIEYQGADHGRRLRAAAVLSAATGIGHRSGGNQPLGIITEADIAHAVADGKDLSSVRIHDLMTTRLTVINPTTSVRDAAKTMTSGHFRHLPVVGDAGLVGMVDIVDVCRALIDSVISRQPGTGAAQLD